MEQPGLCEHLDAAGAALMPMLLDATLKGVVILLLTGIATLAMRRASASARHLVWFLGTLGLLILPILSVTLPAWHVLPNWTSNHVTVPTHPPAPAPVVTTTPLLAPSTPEIPRPPNDVPPLPTTVPPNSR